jgi:hypothetical protein
VGAGIRIPLRVLLPCLAVGLVAFGAVAVGVAGMSAAGGYLMQRADSTLLACASGVLSRGVVAAPGSGPPSRQTPPPVACGWELLSASGQVLALGAPGGTGPAIPVSGSWLAAHLARPVTVPGARASGRWRILIQAVHYWRIVIEAVHYRLGRIPYVYGPDDVEYVMSRRPGPGSGGMVVVMTGLTATGRITGGVAAGYAAAAGTVLVLLAGAALAVTQAILRPLRQAAELAESAAAGGFPRVMPRGGVRAGMDRSQWPFGRTLMTLPEQWRASQAAEAAARRSADEMSQRLGETALELLRSVNVVRGFAESCRQRPDPPAARLDQMLRRVADEAARMEMLIEGLRRAHPRDPPERVSARLAARLAPGHPANRRSE